MSNDLGDTHACEEVGLGPREGVLEGQEHSAKYLALAGRPRGALKSRFGEIES